MKHIHYVINIILLLHKFFVTGEKNSEKIKILSERIKHERKPLSNNTNLHRYR